MSTPFDRIRSAWGAADRRAALHRVVEAMAGEGVGRDALDEALGQLLDDLRAVGADDAEEEIVLSIGDRLHGWCHASRRIPANLAPVGGTTTAPLPPLPASLPTVGNRPQTAG